MKKEMVLFLVISSMSGMNASMNNNDASAQQNPTDFGPQARCCRPGYAVPVCLQCYARIVADNNALPVEKKTSQVPRPLSLSQERERWQSFPK